MDLSWELCRLCGEYQIIDELQDIYDQELNISYRLEQSLKIILDDNELLPNLICKECVASVDQCYQFAVLVSSVQDRFSLYSHDQHEVGTFDFIAIEPEEQDSFYEDIQLKELEIKVERLDPSVIEQYKLKHNPSIEDKPVNKSVKSLSTKRRTNLNKRKRRIKFSLTTRKKCRNVPKRITRNSTEYPNRKLKENESSSESFDEVLSHHTNSSDSEEKIIRKLKKVNNKSKTDHNSRNKLKTLRKLRWKPRIKNKLLNPVEIPNSVRYSCDLCDKTFTRKDGISCHIMKEHAKKPLNIICEICAAGFHNMYYLRAHQTFKTNTRCTNHMNKYHSNKKSKKKTTKVYPCEICGKKLRTRTCHNRHMVIHTGDKPNKCMYCPRSFKHHSGFRYHIRAEHTGERPYLCPIKGCSETFIDNPNGRKHILVYHGLKDLKPILR
ncbi:CLUMA_CG018282, isoform A [Clunio marinus]|uniref:CLUMA_CG018282, isoform A n=1 Tax=Clunio marinus TaxID=568069 RepID=A0A1J1IZ36_9DIPT|nr:CLUMA_CG018282, isoform A [Clunio marinus]